jgi:hypothetical protein
VRGRAEGDRQIGLARLRGGRRERFVLRRAGQRLATRESLRAVHEQRERRAIEAAGERPRIVVVVDRDRTLRDDGARVVFGLEAVQRDAGLRVAAADRPEIRVGATPARQQRGVHAERAAGREREHLGGNPTRPEPREDQVGRGRAERVLQVRGVEIGAPEDEPPGPGRERAQATQAGRVEVPDAGDVGSEAVPREHRGAERQPEIEDAHDA